MTRRRFLEFAAASAGATLEALVGHRAVIDLLTGTENIEDRRMGFLDFVNNLQLTERAVNNALGDHYVSQSDLLREFGGDLLNPSAWNRILKKYPEAGLAWGYFYAGQLTHGDQVMAAAQGGLEHMRARSLFELAPLQNLLNKNSVHFSTDALGNYSATVFFGGKPAAGLVNNLFADSNIEILNLSWQPGETSVSVARKTKTVPPLAAYSPDEGEHYYVGKAADSIVDPRTKQLVLVDSSGKSLPLVSRRQFLKILDLWGKTHGEVVKLSPPQLDTHTAYQPDRLAASFEQLQIFGEEVGPKRIVVAAAGNYNEDLRPIQKYLAPNQRLILAAGYDRESSRPANFVLGADIYVDPPEIVPGLGRESSFATPIVGAMALWLRHHNLPVEQVKEFIQHKWCDRVKFDFYLDKERREIQQEVWLVNPAKIGRLN